MKRNALLTVVWLAVLLFCAMEAHAESLTLEQAITIALEHNQEIKAAEFAAQGRTYEQKSVRGRFLPLLRAEVGGYLWNSDNTYAFDMSAMGQAFAPLLPNGTALSLAPMKVTVRERATVQTSIMLVEPLIQLYKVWAGFTAQGHMAEAAAFDAIRKRRSVELEVSRAFLAHLSARKMVESVEQAMRQVDLFEKQTRDFLEAGLVERDSLLKTLVQREELTKALVEAQKGVKLAMYMLNLQMGRPLESSPELICDGCTDHDSEPSLVPESKAALLARPELRSARHRQQAAEAGTHAAIAELLPEMNLVGGYNNHFQMGGFMKKNEFYGGVLLQWNIWEWGAGWYAMKAAETRVFEAKAATRYAEEGVLLDVEKKRLDLAEAIAVHNAARSKQALANENLRLEEGRYAVHQTTAADLLAAQTQKLQAENDATFTGMQIEMARRDLSVALGGDLLNH